ncbi:hypothetical protein M8C21_012383 [Ambrosia artemisiifolia]|uniref:Peptidase A1 domain-containing protein n=1 Tax=Ambrosia artemisiifolia TaxID=4212 RepID=A0AAD5BUI4_AMBAR|nr:hypothetical protein M8C21_012383 [Ambrosia artemisiifolia]
MRAFIIAATLLLLLLHGLVVVCSYPATLKLERAFPHHDNNLNLVELSDIRDRDYSRHRRFLKSKDFIDFPLLGTYDPYYVGLYYTKVQLGSPPKEYYVQFDTGSDILWVNCKDCKGCPTSSGLKIPVASYDHASSSTSSLISCSDKRCSVGIQCGDADCSNNQCTYKFDYGDGSATSGYYVSDLLRLEMMSDNTNSSSNALATVMFGCSTSQSGELSMPDRAVDGIFGFGQQGLSVISQLASQGAAPDAFSHCLVGDGDGGGILVFGQIMDPNMVYTPLVPSKQHYHLDLQSISVNDKTLSIDPSVFETSHNRKGTVLDSGTTLAYLAEEAYAPFVTAITKSVPQSVQPFDTKEFRCYITKTKDSVSEVFPNVSFNFAGDASMVLKPENYLLRQKTLGDKTAWCIGFQTVKGQALTILGDIVLKDKSVVYDLGGQRIGWVDHDCKKPVNVSTTKSSGPLRMPNASPTDYKNSTHDTLHKLTLIMILAFLLHLL